MTDEKNNLSWSVLYKYRKAVRSKYKTVYKLPLAKKLLQVVSGELKGGETVLDVGASDRTFGEKVLKLYPDCSWKTMDVDTEKKHDYHSLDGINEKFDLIVMAEVIEHIPLEGGVEMLKKLYGLLKDGGKIVVTTPNIHHPNMWMRDADHKVPYRYDMLGAVLMEAGFEFKNAFRIYNDQFIKRFFRVYIMCWVHQYFDIDYAGTIVAVAGKVVSEKGAQ